LDETFEVWPVGHVHSRLTDRDAAPRQGDEGAPDAWIVFDPSVRAAAENIAVGDRLVVITFLHRGDRTTLRVHPRSDTGNPVQGVFTTRSPDRPNPIGLHDVQVLAIESGRMRVSSLEAIDGTPVLDVKPLLRTIDER
jgi:tRNA-Thr(GGU) m(6)t(6)A37 methyltransferase TsaA